MDAPIASAVMLPEPQESEYAQPAASPPAGQKRRQSSVSEHDPKRPRLNSIDANANADRRGSTNDTSSAPGQGRRERGRERRLFGAALGALSQNSATAAQRKRSEIEKRQKAQRELEEQESDQRKLERDVQRKAQRQIEQNRFERESVRRFPVNCTHKLTPNRCGFDTITCEIWPTSSKRELSPDWCVSSPRILWLIAV